jgi:hypothetical protein
MAKSSVKDKPKRGERRVLTADQAADYLGVTRRHLIRVLVRHPVKKGGVPFIQHPSTNRYTFLLSDLDAWIERWRDDNGGGP